MVMDLAGGLRICKVKTVDLQNKYDVNWMNRSCYFHVAIPDQANLPHLL